MHPFQCSVIGGGLSSRMGKDKLLMPFGNSTLIHFTLKKYSVFSHLNLISNSNYDLPDNITTHKDILKSVGPLSGLHTALHHSRTEHCFIAAADMPFTNINLVNQLIPHIYKHDIAIFTENQRKQYLFGFYSKKILPLVEELIARATGATKVNTSMRYITEIAHTYTAEATQFPDYNEYTFFNINTPHDYETALKIRSTFD